MGFPWNPFFLSSAVLPVCYQREHSIWRRKKVSRSVLRQYLCGFHAIAKQLRWLSGTSSRDKGLTTRPSMRTYVAPDGAPEQEWRGGRPGGRLTLPNFVRS